MTGYSLRCLFIWILIGIPYSYMAMGQHPDNKDTLVNHQEWGRLLTQYVDSSGHVDYKAFKQDISSLEYYLEYLGNNAPLDNWPREERLAYYINLYNAATVKLILDHYPVNSIRDIKQPWGRKWISVGNEELSLNQIEHKMLRKMDEPRIHFAINCASTSCPKLLNIPFEGAKLEQQLELVTREFINDPIHNEISQDKVALSALFKWYRDDFTKSGTLLAYIAPYSKIPISKRTKITYKKYNWSLNEQ